MAKGSAVSDELLNIGIIAGLIYAAKWLVDSGYLGQTFEKIREVSKDIKLPEINLPGLGGGRTGSHIYKTTGRKCSCSAHNQQIGCSGGRSPSVRVDCNNCGFVNYEATARVQMGGGCGCGEEATVKHYGPTHQDGNCCWAISNVEQNGTTFFGGEGPHPETDNNQMKLGSVGSLKGKQVGIKSIVYRRGGGYVQELYVDPSGSMTNWRKMGQRSMSSWGHQRKTNRIASNQQVEFRIDCSGAKWLSYEVAEISV